eukprot:22578-Pelagomonas_calceolata.AAC.1
MIHDNGIPDGRPLRCYGCIQTYKPMCKPMSRIDRSNKQQTPLTNETKLDNLVKQGPRTSLRPPSNSTATYVAISQGPQLKSPSIPFC